MRLLEISRRMRAVEERNNRRGLIVAGVLLLFLLALTLF
jgi:hypothetical protein